MNITMGLRRERFPLIMGLWAIPGSIAVSEFFLSIAALGQLVGYIRSRKAPRLPRCLWLWLVWAGMECVLWIASPEPALGWSEIRHLLLLGVLFVTLPGLDRMAWSFSHCDAEFSRADRGIHLTSFLLP